VQFALTLGGHLRVSHLGRVGVGCPRLGYRIRHGEVSDGIALGAGVSEHLKVGLDRLWKQHATPLLAKATRDSAKEFDLTVGTAAAKNGKSAAPGKKAAAVAGWQTTDKFPKPEEVDTVKTTEDMSDKNQFILKDGRKIAVRW
jgi:hypothetical protein